MDMEPQSSAQQQSRKRQKPGFPAGLSIALGALFGVAAGAPNGHGLTGGVVGALLGGCAEFINFFLVKKRSSRKEP